MGRQAEENCVNFCLHMSPNDYIQRLYEKTFLEGTCGKLCYLKSPKNTPSIAVGLDGDEFGIVGASPTINSCHNAREDDLKYLRDRPKGFLLQILPH